MLAVFLALFSVSLTDAKRGKRINFFNQKGGDIVQLRPGEGARGRMLNALKITSQHRWTRYKDPLGNYVIPYIITGQFQPDERRIISGAMRAIERNSCIRFRKRANEADFVDIQNKPNEGCYTTVGRSPGRNIVMLEANDEATCVEHDIAVHELMHTIGLWHEQMRYDRDKYIKIHYENIDPIYYSQFEKISSAESTTYGVPYDYHSVMHYAKDAFAERPGVVTMETLDKKYQGVIGKVKNASNNDYVKICSIYGCKQCLGKPFSGANQSDVVAGASSSLARLQANDDSNQECSDQYFCRSIVNSWTNARMCKSDKVQNWCCATCSGQASWFPHGISV